MVYEFSKFADAHIFAFLVLLIIYISSYSRKEREFFSYRIFMAMVLSSMIQLFLIGIVWFVNRRQESVFIIMNYLFYGFFYILNPLPPLLWTGYTYYQLNDNEVRTKKILKLLTIPFVINTLLVLSSPVFHTVFRIDEYNNYSDGPGLLFTAGLCFSYVAVSIAMVVSKIGKVDKKKFSALLLFSIPLIFGGILDMMLKDVSILWPCVVLALLYAYINLQRRRAHTDSLTGLYNRRRFDEYLEKRVSEAKSGRSFSLILIDLDDFKLINDEYGHTQGDLSLEKAAHIIKSSLRVNDFVARYAGDEFVAVMSIGDFSKLELLVKRIRDNLDDYNKDADIEIGFSIGFDIFNRDTFKKSGDFLKHIDELMYVDKRGKKSR